MNDFDSRLIEKINTVGIKLSDLDIVINYGIKTGYNNAFIIDKTTRDILISEDPSNDKIIRPVLRGRDIKQYTYDFANLWLLYVPWHFPLQNDSSITGASSKAEQQFKLQYPSIYKYLLSHKNKLSNRNKAETGKRYEWYALQRWGANYSDDFKQQNIAWQRITKKNIFCLTEKDMVILDSMAFISHLGDYKYYLLGILNSNVIYYWISLNVPAYGSTGYRLSNQFVVNMPIPKPNDEEFNNISDIVKHMIDNKCEATDSLLNQMIYNLYDLDKDEIIYIESQLKR